MRTWGTGAMATQGSKTLARMRRTWGIGPADGASSDAGVSAGASLDASAVESDQARSRPMRYVLIGGLVAIALIGAICTASVLRLRDRDIAQAERNLKSLDLLLGEETERAIQSADLIVRSLQERVSADDVTGLGDPASTATQDLHVLLKSRIAGIPQISALSIVGRTGMIVATSRDAGLGRDVSDKEHFKVLSTAAPDAIFISEPSRNQLDQRWTSYLARRINDSSGAFRGLVVCAIDLTYFENLYKSLDVGQGGAVSLWRRNGVLMARFPPLPDKTGHGFAIQSFSGILRADGPVTYSVASSLDGTSRIVSTTAAKQYPLVINVTETYDQILSDWRQTAALIAVGGVFCVAAVLLVMLLLARQFRTFAALDVARTERGTAVAARELAEDQMRQSQKLEAVGQLTGGVAHDFNNLLTAVLGNLELLQRHSRTQDERFQRWVHNALEAAQRGAILTQRLLAFSRRQPLNPKATDIAALMRSLSDLLVRSLGENVKLVTRIDPNLRMADVDPNQLDNAILNIAINARDAMDGRGTLTIEARNLTLRANASSGLSAGDYVTITITDIGRGIPAAVLGRVFEPFFTTKPIGQGTGLGLSQVYGFVKQTGGHIELKSEVGVGTRVAITLPCAEIQRTPVATLDNPDETPRLVTALSVLVVEDDPAVLAYSLELMREFGFTTVAATQADEALAVLRDGQRFDLLFTDVGLPGLNGHELALRARRLQADLKVLFVSGYTRDVIMHKGRLDKGVKLLAKPFTRAQLRAKLDQVLVTDVAVAS